MSAVIDVDARVVSSVIEQPSTPTAAASEGELKLVPALVAKAEIEKVNPVLAQMNALIAEIKACGEIDVGTKEGEEKARELRRRCVKLRTSSQAAYEAWNRPLLDAQKGVRAVLKQVEDGINPHETALDKKLKAIDEAREAEKQRKIKEEQDRIAALRKKISELAAIPVAAVSLAAAAIAERIRDLQDLAITDDVASFGEFSDEAGALRSTVISQLLEMEAAKRAQEEEAARLDRERAERLAADARATAERALRSKIDAIKARAFDGLGKPAAEVRRILDEVKTAEPIPVEFAELYAEAHAAWTTTTTLLETAATAAATAEAQRTEQERVAAEQRARLDEIEAKERAEREQREAADRAAAEAERQAAERAQRIEQRLQNLRASAVGVDSASPAQLAQLVERVTKLEIDADSFGDRLEEARTAKLEVLTKLHDAHIAALNAAERAAEAQRQADERAAQEVGERTAARARALDSEADGFGDIVDSVVQIMGDADYPTETGGSLEILELLTNDEVLAEMRRRLADLRASEAKHNATTLEIPL